MQRTDHLTKYERAKLVGMRALQLSMGANTLLPPSTDVSNWTPVDIASEELERGMILAKTERRNGRNESVTVLLEHLDLERREERGEVGRHDTR